MLIAVVKIVSYGSSSNENKKGLICLNLVNVYLLQKKEAYATEAVRHSYI